MNYSYLLSTHATRCDLEVIIAIFNTISVGRAVYGSSDGQVDKTLWIVQESEVEPADVLQRLYAVSSIKSAMATSLSHPIQAEELASARTLFTSVELDTSDVSEEKLTAYLQTNAEGHPVYYIDIENRFVSTRPVSIQIKPLQEHPEFSPAWFSQPFPVIQKPEGRNFTIDEFETITETETIDMLESGTDESPPTANKAVTPNDEAITVNP